MALYIYTVCHFINFSFKKDVDEKPAAVPVPESASIPSVAPPAKPRPRKGLLATVEK